MVLTIARPLRAYAVRAGRVYPVTLWEGEYVVEEGANPHDPSWGAWLYLVKTPPGFPADVRVGMAAERMIERAAARPLDSS